MSLFRVLSTLGEIAAAFGEEVKFPKDVGDAFLERVAEKVDALHGEMCDLSRCESPIEQQFYIAWKNETDNILGIWKIYPQHRYKIGEKNYRVDFLVTLRDGSKSSEVIVECDGHDFHEKTKAQAKRDKARDRAFQSIGTPILHFTGSEIYTKDQDCVGEAVNFLLNNLKESSSE